MRSDELIDDVARDMTAIATRSSLRERVIVAIADVPQGPQYGWWVPAMAAAVGVAMTTWLLVPARPADDGAASTTARQEVAIEAPYTSAAGPVIGRLAKSLTPVVAPLPTTRSGQTDLAAPSPRSYRDTRFGPTRIAENESTPSDVPTLPSLPEPSPIVVQAITINEIEVAPLSVSWIEVQALSVEPLQIGSLGGA